MGATPERTLDTGPRGASRPTWLTRGEGNSVRRERAAPGRCPMRRFPLPSRAGPPSLRHSVAVSAVAHLSAGVLGMTEVEGGLGSPQMAADGLPSASPEVATGRHCGPGQGGHRHPPWAEEQPQRMQPVRRFSQRSGCRGGPSGRRPSDGQRPGELRPAPGLPHSGSRRVGSPPRALPVPMAPGRLRAVLRLQKAPPQSTGAESFNKQNPIGFYYFGRSKICSCISKSLLTALSTRGVLCEKI